MTMKLSRRDKIIFLILVVAAVLIAGGLLLVKPKYEESQASQVRLEQKEAERKEVEDKIATLEPLKERLKNDGESVQEAQEIFIDQREAEGVEWTYEISNYIKAMFAEVDDMNITGISFSDLSPTQLSQYARYESYSPYPMMVNADVARKLPQEFYYGYENTFPALNPDVAVGGTVVTVKYGCDEFDTILQCIQIVADHGKNDKAIYLQTAEGKFNIDGVVENIKAALEGGESDEPAYTGELVINFYTLRHMNTDDLDEPVAGGAQENAE